MTARFWVLASLILALVFAGLALPQAGLLALALPLLVYAGAGFMLAPGELQLEAERQMNLDRVSFGKELEVRLSVTNLGESLQEAQIEDAVSPSLAGPGAPLGLLLPLPVQGEAILEYTLQGRRGKYDFRGARVTARDPFNLFQTTTVISAPASAYIFPQVLPLERIPIRPRRTQGFAGPIPSRRGGSGVDFFGVRAYQMGDVQRHLNWKHLARYEQELYTNEYEPETTGDVGLILDARERTNVHVPGDTLFEHSVKAAASLADLFVQEGHPVGLLVYGASLERVFPGYGVVQKERILRALARARTGVNFAMESLNRLPTRFFPPRSQLVIVSPLASADVTALMQLLAQGYSVLILSPNPVEFEARALEPTPQVRLAARLAQAERVLLLQQIRRLGVRVIDWPVHNPLDLTVRAELARQPLNRPRLEIRL